jgi:hypothetical protein
MFLAGLLTGCVFRPQSGQDGNGVEYSAEDFQIPNLNLVSQLGIDTSRIWRSDAIVTRIDLEFYPLTEEDALPGAFLTFVSPADPTSWLLVAIGPDRQGQYEVRTAREGRYEEARDGPQGIVPDRLFLSPQGALDSALSSESGISLSILNSAVWPGSIEVRNSDDFNHVGPAIWIISVYGEIGQPSEYITIDDGTGNLIKTGFTEG